MKRGHITGVLVGIAVAGLLLLFSVFGSWYTVDQGEVGVLLRNGAVVAQESPGLHFKMPWIESVRYIQTRQSKWTNSGSENAMEAYSKDLQPANLRVTVTYSIVGSNAGDLYAKYGDNDAITDKVIVPAIYSAVKIVFGQYDAPTAISNRGVMVTQMKDAIQNAVGTPDVHIDSFQLENVEFSKQFVDAVESRMQQEIAVQQFKQTLLQEQIKADIVRTQANGAADAVVAAAKAEANRIKLVGEASAEAIKARADALNSNPAIVGLTAVEKWNGQLPATMVPGSALPFIGMNQNTNASVNTLKQ